MNQKRSAAAYGGKEGEFVVVLEDGFIGGARKVDCGGGAAEVGAEVRVSRGDGFDGVGDRGPGAEFDRRFGDAGFVAEDGEEFDADGHRGAVASRVCSPWSIWISTGWKPVIRGDTGW